MAVQREECRKFCLVWKIENGNFYGWKDIYFIQSSAFEAHQTTWILLYIPKASSETDLSIVLCRKEMNKKEIPLRFRFELINQVGQKVHMCEKEILKQDRVAFREDFKCMYNSNFNEITILCWIFPLNSESNLVKRIRVNSRPVFNRYIFIESFEIRKNFFLPSTSEKQAEFIGDQFTVRINVDTDKMQVCAKISNTCIRSANRIDCKISVLDTVGSERNLYCSYLNFDSSNKTWKLPDYTLGHEFLAEYSKYIKNGNLTFKFEISFGNWVHEVFYNNLDTTFGKVSNDITTNDYAYSITSEKKDKDVANKDTNKNVQVNISDDLVEDLRRMYTTHLQADVTLQAEDQIFKAHKLLLSARSPVFAAMFNQEMLEKQTGIIKILDVDANILSRFLEYLYTGTLDSLDYTSASKLLMVADKYQVSSLKEKCASCLMMNLSTDSVCDVAVMADMLGHEPLKTSAIEYIVSHAEVVLSSEEWMKLLRNNGCLATEIFCKLSSNLHAKYKSGE